MGRDIYQEVTDRIVDALESGTIPWSQPWDEANGGALSRPRNAISGREYSGTNVLLLWLTAAERGYRRGEWLTYNQARKAGGHVRKGESATTVVYYKTITITEEDEDGNEERKRIPMLKHFNLFNVEQCEGLDLEEPEPMEEPDGARRADVDAWIARTGADIVEGSDRAYYDRSADRITVPELGQYPDEKAGAYYSTIFHELTHWTGAENRLDRDKGATFGDEVYATEELVAEIGSAFLCADHGIQSGGLQHPEYVAHWLKALKADKKAIFSASSEARQAAEFCHDLADADANVDAVAA